MLITNSKVTFVTQPLTFVTQPLTSVTHPLLADANPSPVPNPRPLWVTKWVDYSNKYGFGFQLADKSVGVLFNDSTRMLLAPDGRSVGGLM